MDHSIFLNFFQTLSNLKSQLRNYCKVRKQHIISRFSCRSALKHIIKMLVLRFWLAASHVFLTLSTWKLQHATNMLLEKCQSIYCGPFVLTWKQKKRGIEKELVTCSNFLLLLKKRVISQHRMTLEGPQQMVQHFSCFYANKSWKQHFGQLKASCQCFGPFGQLNFLLKRSILSKFNATFDSSSLISFLLL